MMMIMMIYTAKLKNNLYWQIKKLYLRNIRKKMQKENQQEKTERTSEKNTERKHRKKIGKIN